MRTMIVCLCLLGSVVSAAAEDAACFYPARRLGEQFLYHRSVTLAQIAADEHCSKIEKTDTAAQRTLTADRTTWKYLKVVGGLAVVMTQGEQDAVDADIASRVAAQQALRDEVEQAGVCKFDTLAEVTAAMQARQATRQALLDTAEGNIVDELTDLQADIDAVAAVNLTVFKVAMTRIRETLSQMNTVNFNVNQGLLQEMYLVGINIARCDFARAKVGR